MQNCPAVDRWTRPAGSTRATAERQRRRKGRWQGRWRAFRAPLGLQIPEQEIGDCVAFFTHVRSLQAETVMGVIGITTVTVTMQQAPVSRTGTAADPDDFNNPTTSLSLLEVQHRVMSEEVFWVPGFFGRGTLAVIRLVYCSWPLSAHALPNHTFRGSGNLVTARMRPCHTARASWHPSRYK